MVLLGLESIKEAQGTISSCDLVLFFKVLEGSRESAVFEFKRLSAKDKAKARQKALEKLKDKAFKQIRYKSYQRALQVGVPVQAYAAILDAKSCELAMVCRAPKEVLK